MRARRITAAAGGLLATVLAAGGVAAVAPDSVAGETGGLTLAPAPATGTATAPPSRTVTLITGDRVRLTTVDGERSVASLEPATRTGADSAQPRRARTMTVGDRVYVVPDAALPYVGRQLDLALFDVGNPPRELEVVWSPGVTPRTVPGLATGRTRDRTTAARVSSPAALGAALTAAGGRAGTGRAATATADAGSPFAGIETIRPRAAAAAADPPTAAPAYPQATLIVRGIDALGAAAFSGGVSVSNADDVLRFGSLRSFVEGEVAFSVPVGTYSLSIDITTFAADGSYVSDALLVLPEIDVAAPQTVVTADARTADTPVPTPQTPQPADGQQIQLTYGRTAESGNIATTTYMLLGGAPRVLVTPTEPVSVGEVHWYTYFHLASPAGTAEPYVYDLHLPSDGVVPARFPTTVSGSSLARLDAAYHADTPNHTIHVNRASFAPWELMPFRGTTTAVAPLRRAEYVSALPDVGWVGVVNWKPDEGQGFVQGPLTIYRPGVRRPDTFLAAPLAPGAAAGSADAQPCVVCRQGDVLALDLHPWKDPGGHTVDQLGTGGTLQAGAEVRLYLDDALHGLPGLPFGSITVPPAAADFRLELNTTKSAPWTTTTTRTSTVWRWRSAARTGTLPEPLRCADGTRDCVAEPLLLVAYEAPVGPDNSLPAGAAATIGLRVHQQQVGTPTVGEIGFEVSADDGQTWQPVTARALGAGRFSAQVTPAVGAEFLSFRLRATDPLGNAVDQTIVRAVRVAAG
jgi:hypothetical protein